MYPLFMPRVARIVIPGIPHHITQRGNNRQDTFFVDDDRRRYLAILKEQSKKFGLPISGYCLMTNHVHLIATPVDEDSLALAIGRTNLIYSQYVNRLHGRSGHLWQNRFFSCALDDHHFITALAYVERNPVRAVMTRKATDYPWSSARAHLGKADASGLLDQLEWSKVPEAAEWRAWLVRPEDETEIARLRLNTNRGRPLGTDGFLSKLEHKLGKRLRPLPEGRPPKQASKTGKRP